MRKPNARDHDPVPEAVSGMIRMENPNRFLDACSSSGLTPTLASILRGMRDPERAYAYIYCEVHCQGGRDAVLDPLVECYWAIRGQDVPSGEPVTEAAAVDRDSDDTDRDDDSQDSAGAAEGVSDREFEERVSEALGIARTMDESEVRDRLGEETRRDEPRKHVVAALNRRLDDFEEKSSAEDDLGDSRAVDGGSDARRRDDRPQGAPA